jgi:hypothetical protein
VGLGICSLHASRRGRKMLIMWLLVPLLLSLIVIGPVLEGNRMIGRDGAIPFVIFGILGGIIALAIASQSGRLLKAKFIDDKMLKLGGAGRPFLDSLGSMPAPPAIPVAQPVY